VEEAEQGTPEKMQVGKDGKGGLLKSYSHKGISSQRELEKVRLLSSR
jgi:hypothetical protein